MMNSMSRVVALGLAVLCLSCLSWSVADAQVAPAPVVPAPVGPFTPTVVTPAPAVAATPGPWIYMGGTQWVYLGNPVRVGGQNTLYTFDAATGVINYNADHGLAQLGLPPIVAPNATGGTNTYRQVKPVGR